MYQQRQQQQTATTIDCLAMNGAASRKFSSLSLSVPLHGCPTFLSACACFAICQNWNISFCRISQIFIRLYITTIHRARQMHVALPFILLSVTKRRPRDTILHFKISIVKCTKLHYSWRRSFEEEKISKFFSSFSHSSIAAKRVSNENVFPVMYCIIIFSFDIQSAKSIALCIKYVRNGWK